MYAFEYVAKGRMGEQVEDRVIAASRYAALNLLRAQGLTVISLAEEGESRDRGGLERQLAKRYRRRFVGVSMSEKAVFFRQMAIAMGAGVPLRDALQSILNDLDSVVLRHTVKGIVDDLHDGASFSEAMLHHPHIFDATTTALINAAEESGSMTETLERLADALEHSDHMRRKIKSILAYPLFVVVFFMIVCGIITVFVLPQFEQVFTEFGEQLPTLTRVVFGANAFIMAHAGLFLSGVVLVGVAMWAFGRLPTGRRIYDRAKLKMPLFGKCIHKLLVARICRSLAMMVRGGVPIARAIELTAAISGNRIIEDALHVAHGRIVNGNSIADSLGQSWLFPHLVTRMIAVGESSGRLPDVLDKVGETYERDVEGSVMVAMALFEPIVIVVFGAVILVLVMAIYLPVFTVAAGVK